MKIRYLLGASAASLALLSGCATIVPDTAPPAPQATASLAPRSGSNVLGNVSFHEMPGGLRVRANVMGLTPGEHGFHIHESGDCSAPDAMSAKGHFNPGGSVHGRYDQPDHHAGDMPNLMANAQGEAVYSLDLPGLSLSGPNGVLGRSVVVHAGPDDYRSQPAGNSGGRIACGVIVAR